MQQDELGPSIGSDGGTGQVVAVEPARVGDFERVQLQLSSHRTTKEEERVERNARFTESHAVQHSDQAYGFSLNPGLFQNLFHDDSGAE